MFLDRGMDTSFPEQLCALLYTTRSCVLAEEFTHDAGVNLSTCRVSMFDSDLYDASSAIEL
tara:strand:- start:1918 stop:2100 length:183 start_codon:yes stop_codon:yes gene_type:complete